MELAQPLSQTSPEGREMETNGEGTYSVTFATRDLARATEFLKSKHLRPEPDGSDSVTLGQDQAFGMVVRFTERRLPNDPR